MTPNGSHGKLHRTAKILNDGRRRGSRVAARGRRAAIRKNAARGCTRISVSAASVYGSIRSGMRDLGYIEGRNIAIVGPAKRLHCSPSPGHLQLSSLRPEISRGHHRFARAGVGLFSRWDWPDPEDQALQPVCQQARLCVRAGLVEPVDDGLNRTAVTPGGFQQLLRRVGVVFVMSS